MATEAAVPPDPGPTDRALLGRERELTTLRRTLSAHRLVALTGTVGVGKTTLAAALADSLRGRPYRVRAVDLGTLLAPELFTSTVAQALGVRGGGRSSELGALAAGLNGEPVLLVLDGCERLLGIGHPPSAGSVAASLEYLLDTCPELVILAVGRASPGSRYERTLRLDPLAEAPAATLLGRRARQFGSTAFARRGREHLEALPLCHLLDRNPLAIELAAARLAGPEPGTSARQLMAEVARPAGLLALGPTPLRPDRAAACAGLVPNRTLRAAAASSHELCTDAEKLLWAQLSTVPVGFDLADAEQACADSGLSRAAVELAWGGLIRGSVLVPYGAGSQRHRLPFLLRAYGRERLKDR